MPERIVPAAASSAVPTATATATGVAEAPAATAAAATTTSSATPAAIRQSSPTTKSYQKRPNALDVAHQETATVRVATRRRTRTVAQEVAIQSTSSTGSAQPPPGHSSDLPSGAKTPRPSTTQNVP